MTHRMIRRALVMSAIVASLAGAREASAGVDLASVVAARCEKYAAESARLPRAQLTTPAHKAYLDLCTSRGVDWSSFAGRDYPRQYYRIAYGVDACGDLKLMTPKNDIDTEIKIEQVCGGATTRETAAGGFAAVGVNLVLGLGDMLVAQAKQEAIEYLLSRMGKRFCSFTMPIGARAPTADPPDPDAPAARTIAMAEWFKDTCAVMFPDGAIDVEAFSFGALKAAFKADLRKLPAHLIPPTRAWMAERWPGGEPYVIAAGIAAYVLYDVSKGMTPLEILNDLGDQADQKLKGRVRCDLTVKAKITKECTLILGFVLARTAANAYSRERSPAPSRVIGDALKEFCAHYGPVVPDGAPAAPNAPEQDGACVVSRDDYDKWHAQILMIYRATKKLIDLDRTMGTLATTNTPDEVSTRVLPAYGRALRQLVDALAAAMISVLPEDKDKITDDIVVIDLGFDVFDAIVTDDPSALAKALLGLLSSKLGKKQDAEVVRAVTVIVALGTAKNRDEVQAIMKDIAAPISSYKRKYGATRALVTLSSLVGFMAGGEVRLHSRNADGTRHDPFVEAAPLKLRAPVGIDLSLGSGGRCILFWERGTCNHVGIIATLIDPLALDVSTANDTVSADWKTLFEPGLYVRFGVFRSPFTIALGGNFQWARRSDERCGGDRCFDGAFQIGAFLGVDVPLLVLR